MEFVAYVGEDKETWGQVTGLMSRIDCEKIFIVKDRKTQGFPTSEKADFVEIDAAKPLIELKEEIMKKLTEKLSKEFEVSLSIASGNGKEHMALISALLSIPVGIRFVVFTKEGVKYIN